VGKPFTYQSLRLGGGKTARKSTRQFEKKRTPKHKISRLKVGKKGGKKALVGTQTVPGSGGGMSKKRRQKAAPNLIMLGGAKKILPVFALIFKIRGLCKKRSKGLNCGGKNHLVGAKGKVAQKTERISKKGGGAKRSIGDLKTMVVKENSGKRGALPSG